MKDLDNRAAAAARSQLDLRAATPADLSAIAELWHAGWIDAHLGHVPPALLAHRSLDDLRRMAAERLSETRVATRGLELVGFATMHGNELEQFYVAPASRGTGVAGLLLAHTERLIAASAEVAWLAVVSGNSRARRFYARNGWREVGSFMNPARIANGTLPVPALRLEKRLGVGPANLMDGTESAADLTAGARP